MDEIRCPMCGKLNPPELDDCQYCQARLRPLIVSPSPDENDSQQQDWILPQPDEEESLPDWLTDLRAQDEDIPNQEGIEVEEEMPVDTESEADWLGRLQDRIEEEEIPGQPTSDQEAEPIPDWLPGEEASDAKQVFAWVPEVEFEASNADSFNAAEEEGSLGEEESHEEIVEPPAEEVEEAEIPMWLRDLREDHTEGESPYEEESVAEAEEPDLDNVEIPDWLTDLRVEPDIDEEEVEELPDWFTQKEQESPPEVEEVELDDWLAPFGSKETDLETQPEEAPEWMTVPEVEEAEEATILPLDELSDETEQKRPPEWLAELEKEFSAEPPSQEPSLESEPPSRYDEEIGEETGRDGEPPPEEIPEELEQEAPPEWMAELEKEFEPKSEPIDSDEKSITSRAVDEGEEEGITPEVDVPALDIEEGADFLESLPKWADEVSVEGEPEVESVESELEGAEIPSWLESMRPVESVAPDVIAEDAEIEERVETSGPLTGLSGLLQAQADFSRLRKPPVYSIKLQVTENQEARVKLLRELLADEDKQKPLPAKSIITPQYIFRLVIALLLVIPIAWAVITGGGHAPLPDSSSVSTGVMDVHRLINVQLSANSPVLVAFDYEAGFSGELDIPARAVLSHMMKKDAYLTLVSTSPNGPIMAQRLINDLIQSSLQEGNPFTNYSNMGYVPGGTAGLLSLAQSPQQTIPYTLENIAIWGSAPLNQIVSVADFSMVLVITEDTETARAWIEQVQPFLETNGTPLIMVVSAQAGPLVLPYYQGSTEQVQGLVVGLPDGVAYNSISGQGDLARASWDAFSISMLVTEIILIVGAVVGAGSRLYTSPKKDEV